MSAADFQNEKQLRKAAEEIEKLQRKLEAALEARAKAVEREALFTHADIDQVLNNKRLRKYYLKKPRVPRHPHGLGNLRMHL